MFPRVWPSRWFRGAGLVSELRRHASDLDVLHAHMLWDFPVYAAGRVARESGKPLVITPHGSVSEPWRYRALHKKVYRRLVLDRILGHACFLHALNRSEAEAIKRFGATTPVRVIPNGVAAEDFLISAGDAASALARWPLLRRARVLLFIGRISPEKGLDLLIEAMASVRTEVREGAWKLVIAGPDAGGSLAALRARAGRLGVSDEVLFTGFVPREIRRSLLAAADVFVLPSRSEALSLSLLEAAAAGKPSLYTLSCNLPELAAAGGGWAVAPDAQALALGLRSVLTLDRETLGKRGLAARAFVKEEHTIEAVVEQLLELYSHLVGGSI